MKSKDTMPDLPACLCWRAKSFIHAPRSARLARPLAKMRHEIGAVSQHRIPLRSSVPVEYPVYRAAAPSPRPIWVFCPRRFLRMPGQAGVGRVGARRIE